MVRLIRKFLIPDLGQKPSELIQAAVEELQAWASAVLFRDGDERSLPRRFVLNRGEDLTGKSGVGTVASGVQFSDGCVAMRWFGETPSIVIYSNILELESIHGHDGKTTVVWVD